MLVAIMAIMGTIVYGQEKTTSFKVYGNCAMCKKRIEKAANIDGVSKAMWNVESKIVTIAYDSNKVGDQDIQKRIAQAGHDTQDFTAPDTTYNKLPGCCQYNRKMAEDSEQTKLKEREVHQHNH